MKIRRMPLTQNRRNKSMIDTPSEGPLFKSGISDFQGGADEEGDEGGAIAGVKIQTHIVSFAKESQPCGGGTTS